jgi:hypothetical protein
MSPVDRHLDPRWNACVDQLCAIWNAHGPDRALAALEVLARSDVTPEGLLVLEIAPREKPAEPPRCICPRFRDTGGVRIADLCCPVHGVDGTDPGDGYWDDDPGSAPREGAA